VRPYEEPIVTFRIMLRGYREAVGRFRIAAATMDPEPGIIALFEALNWAVALDERCGKHWAPDGEPLGSKWLERWSGDVAIARGIRFARNRAHHQWAEALMLHFVNVRSDRPNDEFEWRWRAAAELPSAPPERADRRGEKAYEELLAGHAAETTLSSVEDLYDDLANLLEPRLARSRAIEARS
jgi:hypothetical protein